MTSPGDDRIERAVERIRAGNERAVARAMRLIDERAPLHRELLGALHPHTGRAKVLGITGTPGAGKSTLVDRIVEASRAAGERVGVIAVDPTSPYSGGAILGDRIRMQRHFLDRDVFIRSLATRGHMGGLSRSAADVLTVLDAAGFDRVIVETVGVGQDELEIAQLADTTIVVVAPGLGDDIQAIKAGILEIADIFAVNKSDRDGADATVADLQQMVALGGMLASPTTRPSGAGHSAAAAIMRPKSEGGAGERGWETPIVKTIASAGAGVQTLLERCAEHHAWLLSSGDGARRRADSREQRFVALARELLFERALDRDADRWGAAVEDSRRDGVDPYATAESWLESVLPEATA